MSEVTLCWRLTEIMNPCVQQSGIEHSGRTTPGTHLIDTLNSLALRVITQLGHTGDSKESVSVPEIDDQIIL